MSKKENKIVITVTMDPQQVRDMKRVAEDTHRSMSGLVCYYCKKGLEREMPPPAPTEDAPGAPF